MFRNIIRKFMHGNKVSCHFLIKLRNSFDKDKHFFVAYQDLDQVTSLHDLTLKAHMVSHADITWLSFLQDVSIPSVCS